MIAPPLPNQTLLFSPGAALRPQPAPVRAQHLGRLLGDERRCLEDLIESGHLAFVLYFEIDGFFMIENLFGDEIAARIMNAALAKLRDLSAQYLPTAEAVFVTPLDPGKCLTLWADNDPLVADRLDDLAFAFRVGLRGAVRPEAVGLTGQSPELRTGHALVPQTGGHSLEHCLYSALCDAVRSAKTGIDLAKLSLLREFREIVDQPLLSCVYQPIVDLCTGKVAAWEALARSPRESRFANPSMLFDFAEEAGGVFGLEKTCREMAIKNFGQAAPGQKLFLNVHPQTLADPDFTPGQTLALLRKYGMSPGDVVLEITERHRTKDFALFHRTLEHYRREGFMVAVDDMGTGYSGLYSIAEIRPDLIKIDMSLIRGIDANPVKRALLETFITFADRVGCRIVAEGVETATELSCLISLGVHFGQGYFIARPKYPKPEPSLEVGPLILRAGDKVLPPIKCGLPIGDLAEEAATVSPDTLVLTARRLIEEADVHSCVVVLSDKKPAGLIMSHHLNKLLSTQYGTSLYAKRRVLGIMDAGFLMVDACEPVEAVSKAAMSREKFKVYDHIVVTRGGDFLGVVSVQKMLDALTRMQVELAKGANPLTGLPGNMAIDREIETRLAMGNAQSFIYADLDNFKVYNDTYGFHEGDQVILLAARILGHAAKRHGGPGNFLGHLGGDDFFLALSPERAEAVCRAVTALFGRLARYRYSEEDRRLGAIKGKDRYGNEGSFALVSISLAVIDCRGGISLGEVAKRAAELKKYAKSKPGNVYVRDRRSGAPLEGENTDQAPAAESKACAPL